MFEKSRFNIFRVTADNMRFLIMLLGAASFKENNAQFYGMGNMWKPYSHKAKYSTNALSGGYFKMPKSLADKTIKEYVQVDSSIAKLTIPGSLWCHPNDSRVCLMFDKNGTCAGVQISFLDKDTVNVTGYNYSSVNTYIRTNIYNSPANSLRIYYTNPEKLTAAGRPTSKETAEGVWVYLKGDLVHLPKDDPKVKEFKGFYRQNCYPQMGQHYFYQLHSNHTDCAQHVPFFGLYHNKGLIGFGVAGYGRPSQAEGGRDWYEKFPLMSVMAIIPHRPSCMDELVKENGFYSVHVYFVEMTYLIGCRMF